MNGPLAKLPPGPYRVEWPTEQGGLFTLWGRQGTPPDFRDGWAIPLVARGVDTAMFALAELLNQPIDVGRLAVAMSAAYKSVGSWDDFDDTVLAFAEATVREYRDAPRKGLPSDGADWGDAEIGRHTGHPLRDAPREGT